MRVTIPEASANRLRQAYANFEQLSAVVAEAMGLDAHAVAGIDVPGGAFLIKDPDLPAPPAPVEVFNGVAGAADV